MAFTYDLSTDIGKIRLRIDDKAIDDAYYSDEEIQAYLDMAGGNITKALIIIYYAKADYYFANEGDKIRVDDIEVEENKQKGNYYLNLAKSLENQMAQGMIDEDLFEIYTGGVVISDINSNNSKIIDKTIKDTAFSRDMFNTFGKTDIYEERYI